LHLLQADFAVSVVHIEVERIVVAVPARIAEAVPVGIAEAGVPASAEAEVPASAEVGVLQRRADIPGTARYLVFPNRMLYKMPY